MIHSNPKRSLSFWLAAVVALLACAALSAVASAQDDRVEYIQNGDFSSGFGPWWSTSSVTTDTSTGELAATITAGGANPWDAIVGQAGVPVQAGADYTLSFRAKASVATSTEVKLQEDGGSFAQYLTIPPVALTTDWQDFSFDFASPATDAGATFQFQMGGQGEHVIYIDDVSLLGPEQSTPVEIVDKELVNNGTFDGLSPWFEFNANGGTHEVGTPNNELEVVVTNGADVPWASSVAQNPVPVLDGETYTFSFKARADQAVTPKVLLQENGGSFTAYFAADFEVTTEMQEFSYQFVSPGGDPAAQLIFQFGNMGAFTIYVDDVSLFGPAEVPLEESVTAVKVNHVGYLPDAAKYAVVTVKEGMTDPVAWTLYDSAGNSVASGVTMNFGFDVASEEYLHQIDFSDVTATGEGYVMKVGDEESNPFTIAPDIYSAMANDALHFFYHQRSGIEIEEQYVSDPIYARPAGHVDVAPNQGDGAVPCFDGMDTEGVQYQGCDYTLDLRGGWYDAGDHGKYVVNGGISVWTLLNVYERSLHVQNADASTFGDGTVNIPEQENGMPDILDETRWEIDFMLRMQVPEGGAVEGKELGGMVHHKMADVNWTGLPMLPHLDPQPRVVYPPSTAATLNMAANAAQCARLYAPYDTAFAQQCLDAAEVAWQAALDHPEEYARNNFTGSGPYDDSNLSDEFYWAAAELFITTGEQQYLDFMQGSEHYLTISGSAGEGGGTSSMYWGDVAALGNISLLTAPNELTSGALGQLSDNLVAVADGYLEILSGEGYRLPMAVDGGGRYGWGSNSSVQNNQLILGVAYDQTLNQKYLDGVSEGMDYILGRNAMARSYVSGYGENASMNMHHRFWANQKDESLPNPPDGVISGGPNSGLEDPVAQVKLVGCAPQKCYLDDIDSWSTNELTINWNAPLVWVTAFLDEVANRTQVQNVNSMLTLDSMKTSYDRTPQPSAPAGVYTIRAAFNNSSDEPLRNIHFEVVTLTNGNLLLNADGGPAGEGAVLSVPATALGNGDAILQPGEAFEVAFEIGLQNRSRFDFYVDAYGVGNVPESAPDEGEVVASLSFDIADADENVEAKGRSFLPHIR